MTRVNPEPNSRTHRRRFTGNILNYFRVHIHLARNGEHDSGLRFDFPGGTCAGLHARHAVAAFIAGAAPSPRNPDTVLKRSPEARAKVHPSAEPVDQFIEDRYFAVTANDAADAARVINLFDHGGPARAMVVRSTWIQDHA